MSAVDGESAANSATSLGKTYAGFWVRLAAAAIDLLPVAAILYAATVAIVTLELSSTGQNLEDYADDPAPFPIVTTLISFILVAVITAYAIWSYFAELESSRWQGTIGKKLCRLAVSDGAGERISRKRAHLRVLGKLVSAAVAFLGFFMIAWTPRKRGLHDLIAGTLVLRRPRVSRN